MMTAFARAGKRELVVPAPQGAGRDGLRDPGARPRRGAGGRLAAVGQRSGPPRRGAVAAQPSDEDPGRRRLRPVRRRGGGGVRREPAGSLRRSADGGRRRLHDAQDGRRTSPAIRPAAARPFPCGSDAWNRQIWNVTKYRWQGTELVAAWTFESDWKPEPNVGGLRGWEPVFLPAMSGTVPLRARVRRHRPSRLEADGRRGRAPLSVRRLRRLALRRGRSRGGSVRSHRVRRDRARSGRSLERRRRRARGSCGSRRTARRRGRISAPSWRASPRRTIPARRRFPRTSCPWPPSPDAVPPTAPCGSQRPGINVVPAIAPDGTIYTVSRAHDNSRYAYLVAVHPDLTPAWSASLRGILNDGCGVLVPIDDTPGGCRAGAHARRGSRDQRPARRPRRRPVDRRPRSSCPTARCSTARRPPTTTPADTSSSSTPSGSFLATLRLRLGHHAGGLRARRHLLDRDEGQPLQRAVRRRALRPLLARREPACPSGRFTNTNTESCARQPDGSVVCVRRPPGGLRVVRQPARRRRRAA